MKAYAVRVYLRACKMLERLGWEVRHLMAGERRSGVRIHWRRDHPDMLRGGVVRVRHGEFEFRFFVENDLDSIQREHRKGQIYEPEELEIIRRHYVGGTFVDVGGNVGNHAVYAAVVLNAPFVLVFEPEPLAAEICRINAALNHCSGKIRIHQAALADVRARAFPDHDHDNLGGTRMQPAENGTVEMLIGDQLLGEEQVGFIKVDTEGFELRVLAGLTSTIRRCRPPLFVEVENDKIEAFRAFCNAQDYAIAEEFRRYPVCTNYLALPLGGTGMKD